MTPIHSLPPEFNELKWNSCCPAQLLRKKERGASPSQELLEKEAMIHENKSNRPDEELARLVAEGNVWAFEEIYNRYRRFVYSIALRMTGNQADAEDLTQESFVSVLRRVGSFRGDAAFTTWLYRLVTNQVLMHFRYRSSRPEIQASDEEIPEGGSRVARSANAESLIDRLAIEKAVRMLPAGYRAAFIMHDVEGYKHEEAALLLGFTSGTSKSQLHKARANLRAALSRPATRA